MQRKPILRPPLQTTAKAALSTKGLKPAFGKWPDTPTEAPNTPTQPAHRSQASGVERNTLMSTFPSMPGTSPVPVYCQNVQTARG